MAAEQAAATTLVSSLQMASGAYMTKTGVPPNGFTDFVSIGAYSPESSYTINIAHIGDKDLSQCQIESESIDCTQAFNHIKPVYRWNNNQISVDFQ